MEWTKQTYNNQYEKWMPWIEDVYLRWFTNDNKASYATKRKWFSPRGDLLRPEKMSKTRILMTCVPLV